MQPNVLMCRYVCELLPPARQAHLRSAGSLGYDAFEELVALGDVPAYVEVVAGEGGDARLGALMNAPIRGVKKPMRRRRKIPEEYVIVFWEGAMRRRDIRQPSWSHLPWKSIRYHLDPDHPQGSCFTRDFMSGSKAALIEPVYEGAEALAATPIGFLSQCLNLEHAGLTLFKNVRVIHPSFMLGCGSLTELKVDLSPFSNVHTVRSAVLYGLSIATIDLVPLRNVTSIGDSFLGNNLKLTSIDLSPFVNVRTIGSHFMSRCVSLTSIDLTPLASSLKIIKHQFLSHCSGLTHVDLKPLKAVDSIGHGMLQWCTGLRTISLPTFDHPDDTIGPLFLNGCSELQEIDLSPLHNMTVLPAYFLACCTSLTSIDLAPLSGITSRGVLGDEFGYLTPYNMKGNFMVGCTGITHLDLSPMVLLSKKEKKLAVMNSFDGRITWGGSSASDGCTLM